MGAWAPRAGAGRSPARAGMPGKAKAAAVCRAGRGQKNPKRGLCTQPNNNPIIRTHAVQTKHGTKHYSGLQDARPG